MSTGLARPDRPAPWPIRRLFPVLGTVGLIVIGMACSIWGPRYYGKSPWTLPDDLWSTLVAAQRLLHLDLGGLYTQPTNLVSFPGAAVILVPLVALMDAAGLPLHAGSQPAHPAEWLLIGPYTVAISAVTLFAADALAERLGLSRPKRMLLAAASAAALWNVTLRWGHPEDAVATGLLLYGVLALSRSRTSRAGWLVGAAVAVQPLVLLAVPLLAAVLEPRRARRLAGFLARTAAPAVVLLGAAAAANWNATITAVTKQPNWPQVNHPTPWLFLAPRLGNGTVAAGPGRTLAIVVACLCALGVAIRWRSGRRERATGPTAEWSREELTTMLWWTAVALALRCVFESVMVSYYVWPALAVALIPGSRNWPRLLATGTAAVGLTFISQASWRGAWGWWGPVTGGLGLVLVLAGTWPARSPAARPEPSPVTALDPSPVTALDPSPETALDPSPVVAVDPSPETLS
jgi:hypothetical protein